jgi:hypothetical protein
MPKLLENRAPIPAGPQVFQFSLRTLFIFSFLVAVFSAGIFNNYNFVRYLTLLAYETILFYVFLAWAIYARGYLRTFGIGASLSFLFPWLVTGFFWFVIVFGVFDSNAFQKGLMYVFSTNSLEDGFEFFWPSIAALLLIVDSLMTGGAMVLARWMIDRRRQIQAAAAQAAPPAISATVVDAPPKSTA